MAERVYCLYRGKDQESILMQKNACHDFAEKKGWNIVGEEQEIGVSGYKVSADDRDKLQLIKKYAEQGKFDILLVFMFDRLGRKSDETPFVVEWFTKKGVRVWSVQEGEQRFESHTDRLTNYIRFWQADGESQKTSMRTKTALGQMVEEAGSAVETHHTGTGWKRAASSTSANMRCTCWSLMRTRPESSG